MTWRSEPFWYKRFRVAVYCYIVIGLAWTVLIVLPFRPFSYLPPIIVGGGPAFWFSLSYLLFLIIGLGGFGTIANLLYTIEEHENRPISTALMWPAFILLCMGFVASSILLAIAGAIGGYASTIQGLTGTPIHNDLSPFVDPITITVLIAVVGAALAILSMARAGRGLV